MIDRRNFLLSPLALAGALKCADRKPNMVLLTVQNVKGQAVPWSGDPNIIAPNLEKFGKESVVFTRAYSACTDPASARVGLLTGKFPHAARTDSATMASALKDGGYRVIEGIELRKTSDAPFFVEIKLSAQGMDHQFGLALDAFDSFKQNTIIVFCTSSGVDPGNWSETGLRIALAIRYPGVLQPAAHELASEVDVMPTCLALCGVELPDGVQGRNFFGSGTEESIYAEGKLHTKDEWRMLVRGTDKLIAKPSGEVLHLFNLSDDPLEETDLAHDTAQKLKRDSLVALLRVMMKKLSDGFDPSGLRQRPK